MNPLIEQLGKEQGWLDYPYHSTQPPDDDYGYSFEHGLQQYHKELFLYAYGRQLGIGNGPFFHLCNAIRLNLPNSVEFAARGYVNHSLLRVLWNMCEFPDLGIAGAASTTKTFPVGLWILHDWSAAPKDTLTFCCTTSLGASDDRIWGQVVTRYKDQRYPVGELVEYRKTIVWGGVTDDEEREYKSAIKALAIEEGLEGKKAIDTTRGRKNERVRLVFDEMPEMGKFCSKARVNLRSNPDFRFTGIGNPNLPTDAHGDLCQPVGGWDSVNSTIPEWMTRTGKCIFLNGQWSPNFDSPENEPTPFPYMTSRESLAGMLELCYGNRDAIEYMRNAIGFWPKGSKALAVISAELVKFHKCDEKAEWAVVKRTKSSSLDVGFTAGGDKCVAHFAEQGIDLSGRQVLEWNESVTILAKEGEVFEKSIAKQYVDLCVDRKIEPGNAGMDISSDGGKIYAEVVRYWITLNPDAPEFQAISSMGKASERIVDPKRGLRGVDVFDRRVTELWISCRMGVQTGVLKNFPLGGPVIEQFSEREFYNLKGDKKELETKPDMKERIGYSPDDADSYTYLVEIARLNGLEFISEADWLIREGVRKRRKERERFTHVIGAGAGDYGSNSWGED